MQYRKNIKIIIDKRKLDILLRLGCPDEQILQVIKTGRFDKTGDQLIDETLETFADKKEFNNWGGNHNPKGINGCNKKKKAGQVDRQVGGQVGGQVVDIDKDKDIDKDIDIDNNILDAFNKWIKYKKERKEKYTKTGLNACAKKLERLSGGNPDIAMQIVDESIANNWAGLFPLKDKPKVVQVEQPKEDESVYIEVGEFYIDDDEKYSKGYSDLAKQLTEEQRDNLWNWFIKNFQCQNLKISFIRKVLQKAINEGAYNAD